MHRATVSFPSKLDLGSIFSFARELDYCSQHDELILDMGEQKFFSPFAMLFLAAKMARMRTENAALKILVKRHQQHVYPAHVGFFRMFGVDYGRDLGEALGSENYLPITRLDREAFYTSPADRYQEFPDLVQRQADQIAKVITRDKPENGVMFDALSYSIREVMRNVFEHSEAERLFYCAPGLFNALCNSS